MTGLPSSPIGLTFLMCPKCRNLLNIGYSGEQWWLSCPRCDIMSILMTDPKFYPDYKTFGEGEMEETKRRDWTEFQAEQYVGERVEDSLEQDRFEFVRKTIGEPPKKVVEMACANGAFTLELQNKGFDIIGADLPLVIEHTKVLHPNLQLLAIDLDREHLPEKLPKSDVVLAMEIIEHLIHDFEFLVDVREILNPRGKLIITTPVRDNITYSDHHLRFYTKNSLGKILDVAGYSRITIEEGPNSLLAVAVR